MCEPMITAIQVGLKLGNKVVLRGVSAEIPAGRVVGLFGHNGVGKTSLLRALIGELKVSGQLEVLGKDPYRHRAKLLREVSYTPDIAYLPTWANVGELFRLVAGLHPRFSAARAVEILKQTTISSSDKVGDLSKGMVGQVQLTIAASIDAKLMLLDEPILGLDGMTRQLFYKTVINEWCSEDKSVILSTHVVDELEPLLTDVLILKNGSLVYSDSVSDIADTRASKPTGDRLRLVDLLNNYS
jgi:ABC-2 type transport system ATP-binding protein